MTTQLLLNIDAQTIELANHYAKEKGLSVSELFEYYIRLITLNEQLYKLKNIDISSVLPNYEQISDLKKTNWKELDKQLMPIRHGLPIDYRFDRDLANERYASPTTD